MAKWHQLDAFDRLIACCCENNQHSPKSMVVIQDLLNAYADMEEAARELDAVIDFETPAIDGLEGNMNFEDVTSLNAAMIHLAAALKNLATVMGDSLT